MHLSALQCSPGSIQIDHGSCIKPEVIITSLLRQNDVVTSLSFWRNNDVIFKSCIRWGTSSWAWSFPQNHHMPSISRNCHKDGTLYYSDVIMDKMASRITSLSIVYLSVHSGEDHSKHQSSASLAFVRGIHRWPVNSPHKGPVTRKMFPFDDVIMDMYRQAQTTITIAYLCPCPK